MTIIDSLIVKLGLDSKDLDTKSGTAGKRLKDLEGASKSTTGEVKKLSDQSKATASSVGELTKAFTSLLAVIGGAYAIKSFIQDTIASNAALDRLSKNLGVSVEDLSAWGNAVEALGGSAKGLQGTLSMLSQQQTELRLTGTSSLIPYFSSLGVAISDVGGKAPPVNDILLDLAERFSHMDRATANNEGKMMGIDQDTLNLLLQGRREVELTLKRQKEYNAVTKEQAEQSAKLQKSLIDLRQSFTSLGRDLLQQAAPALEKLLGVLSSLGGWIRANMEFIKDLGKVLGAIGAGLGVIALATSPISLVVLAIGALAIAIAGLWQDYQNWKRGGDSLIDWEKWRPGIDAAKAAIKDLAKVVKESFGAIFDEVGALQKLIQGDWKGALADARKSDDKVRGALGAGAHAVVTVAKVAPAEHRAIATANGQTVTDAYAMQYFMSRGMSSKEAAAYTSQIHSESNGKVNAVGDHGSAYGLIQWHKDRQENFKKFTGKDIRQSTADEQLGFIVHEVKQGTEQAAGRRVAAAQSAEEAGRLASEYYVRPADREGEAKRRGAYASQLSGIPSASSMLAMAGRAGSSSTTTSDDHSTTVNMHGNTIINTQATDASGMAREWLNSFKYQFTAQANSGLN